MTPAPPAVDLELDAVFKRLNLANARRVWRDLVARAEREDWPYDRFLTVLVAEEIAHRQQTAPHAPHAPRGLSLSENDR